MLKIQDVPVVRHDCEQRHATKTEIETVGLKLESKTYQKNFS